MTGDVFVLGYYHDPVCLVARYREAAERREAVFPWCTCKRAYRPPMTGAPADRCER